MRHATFRCDNRSIDRSDLFDADRRFVNMGRRAVDGAAFGIFPEGDFDDVESVVDCYFRNQTCEILGRRNDVEYGDRFVQVGEDLHGWVVGAEDHSVIEKTIDPILNRRFQGLEIDDHPELVEPTGTDRDQQSPVMPVQSPARARVADQAMSVAEMDFS